MAPISSSSILPTDATNPSIPERIIRHRWEGSKYTRADGNFLQWTEKLKDSLILNGIYSYVFDDVAVRPSIDTEPRAYANWGLNDRLAITFIKSALDDAEHRDLVTDNGAAACYADLKARAQREGPIKQVALLQDALSTYCSMTEPLPTTAGRIVDTVKRAFDIGTVDVNLFTCIALLNSLNDPAFESLQNSVSTLLSSSTQSKPCSPADIRILMENAQNILNVAKSSPATVFSVRGGTSTRSMDLPGHNHGHGATCCENCFALKRPCKGHTKAFCVQKGGGMMGKSIAEAQDAQRASRGKSSTTSKPASKAVATSPPKSYVAVTGLDGKMWYVDPSQLGQLPVPTETAAITEITAFSSDPLHSTECWEHIGFTVMEDDGSTVDWNTHAGHITENILAADVTPINHKGRTPLSSLHTTPFLVDSSVTVHISPCCDDFMTLRPIQLRSVKGLGGSTVAAIGIGNI